MKFCLDPRSAYSSLALLVGIAVASSLTACAFLERADAEKASGEGGDGDGDGDGDASGGSSGAGGAMGLGGAAGTGGGADAGYNGCSPIEPNCDAGENLITNGDFANGDVGWNGQNGTLDVSSGAACIDGGVDVAMPAGIGWGDAATNASLETGAYTFSFDVTIEGAPTLIARVGGVEDPWPTYFEEDLGAVSSGTQTLTVPIDMAVTAGVVFFVNNGRVCVDNVSLSRQ